MGEVVEHEIPHTGKTSSSVGGQKTSFMPCKVFHSSFVFIVFVVICFVNATPLTMNMCLLFWSESGLIL